jgi:hypothetical protein
VSAERGTILAGGIALVAGAMALWVIFGVWLVIARRRMVVD